MPYSKKIFTVAILFLAIAAIPPYFYTSQVTHHPTSADKLNDRWDWAVQEARKQAFKDGYWIGYSIKRLMGEYSYICSTGHRTFSGNFSYPLFLRGKPLGEILYRKEVSGSKLSDEEQVQLTAKRALAEIEKASWSQRKVWKDVAVLFKFASSSSKIPETIRLNNLSMPFGHEDLPILWLDKAEDEESITFLTNMYQSSDSEEIKKKILSAIGFHGSSAHVIPFLENVLRSQESDKLRGKAASELEDYGNEQVVKTLHQAAKNDRSYYVQKKALYALEDVDVPGATDALIDIARNAVDSNIRKKAIYCLADKASKKAISALEDFVYEDEDTEVQKRAVYALEDLHDGEGVPYLIKVAKSHPKLIIRKKAIYCLGDSDDPRALKALIEILREK